MRGTWINQEKAEERRERNRATDGNKVWGTWKGGDMLRDRHWKLRFKNRNVIERKRKKTKIWERKRKSEERNEWKSLTSLLNFQSSVQLPQGDLNHKNYHKITLTICGCYSDTKICKYCQSQNKGVVKKSIREHFFIFMPVRISDLPLPKKSVKSWFKGNWKVTERDEVWRRSILPSGQDVSGIWRNLFSGLGKSGTWIYSQEKSGNAGELNKWDSVG